MIWMDMLLPDAEKAYHVVKCLVEDRPHLAYDVVEAPSAKASKSVLPSGVCGSKWHTMKRAAMKAILIAKWEQVPQFRESLLSTFDRQLMKFTSHITHTVGDDYWGCGVDGSGRDEHALLLKEVLLECI